MGRRVPTMQAVLPPQRLKWQARLLLLALLLLLLLPVMPSMLASAAGLAFALSQGMMGALLMLCLFSYRRELLPVLLASKVKQ
jgi:ABC-type sulfate transport system permease component